LHEEPRGLGADRGLEVGDVDVGQLEREAAAIGGRADRGDALGRRRAAGVLACVAGIGAKARVLVVAIARVVVAAASLPELPSPAAPPPPRPAVSSGEPESGPSPPPSRPGASSSPHAAVSSNNTEQIAMRGFGVHMRLRPRGAHT
jgi:hypothetical protein